MPSITSGNSLQFFFFPCKLAGEFDKNVNSCPGNGQTYPGEMIQVLIWGAGIDRRVVVSI